MTDTAAARRVAAVYGILDLLGNEAALLAWADDLRPGGAADELMPQWLTADSQGVMAAHLRAAEVITDDGGIDALRLAEFQAVVSLVPYFHAQERIREPPPKARVVFTVPPQVSLPDQASHMRRQLVVRVADALASATPETERVLLAGPYWSPRGAEQLVDAFDRAVAYGLPITFAGAKEDPQRSDLLFMRRFAGLVANRHPSGGDVTVLEFVAPARGSLFHAKLALGRTGYLGSANFTGPGLGDHVEAGVPLDEVDVARVWWLMAVLQHAGMLRPVAL